MEDTHGKKFYCKSCGVLRYAEDKDAWAYKIRRKKNGIYWHYFCSWHCLRKYEEELEEKYDRRHDGKGPRRSRFFISSKTGELITAQEATEISGSSITDIYKFYKKKKLLLGEWIPITRTKEGIYLDTAGKEVKYAEP